MDKTQKIIPEKHKLFWVIFSVMAIIYVITAGYFQNDFFRSLNHIPFSGRYLAPYYMLPLILLFIYWFILYFRKKFTLTFVVYFFLIQIISIFLIMSQTLYEYTYGGVNYLSLPKAINLTLFLLLFDIILVFLSKNKMALHSIFILFVALFLFLMFIYIAPAAVLG